MFAKLKAYFKTVLQTIHRLLYALYLFCACVLEILQTLPTGRLNETKLLRTWELKRGEGVYSKGAY